MKSILFCLAMLISFSAGAFTFSGKVFSTDDGPLPYATVFIKGTTRGTTTNQNGEFTLTLAPGKYTIVFRFIGYETQYKDIEITNKDEQLTITMKPERSVLKEAVVSAGAEDPAYAVMRKAIKMRKHYRDEVDGYSCNVYIKGVQRMRTFRKKFMGQTISADMLGVVDTNSGIMYLSESVAKYAYEKPDRVHEEMVSSLVSGRSNGFSYNQASDFQYNFYDNLVSISPITPRGCVSPLSATAMLYYHYHLAGVFRENGLLINKIEVKPIRSTDPAFRGTIYIVEDSWRIHSLNLYLSKDAGIALVDTFRLIQTFAPVDSSVWMPISNSFLFTFNILGFKGEGVFTAVSSDYAINPRFPKGFFTNEVMKIEAAANKKDSSYWQKFRPVPLTAEEKKDYVKKDSFEVVRKSKPYLDSLDRKTNKFKWSNALLGYGYSNSYKKQYISIGGPLQDIGYNPVEGANINIKSIIAEVLEDRERYSITPTLHYGFSNHLLTANLEAKYRFNPQKSGEVSLAGGNAVEQYNQGAASPFINTFYSLLEHENYLKLYEKTFINGTFREEVTNGINVEAKAEYDHRHALVNTSDFSLFKKSNTYTSNDPQNPLNNNPAFADNNSLTGELKLTFNPGRKYYLRPYRKVVTEDPYPTFTISMKKAFSYVLHPADYDLVRIGVHKEDISFGLLGHGSFSITAGKFLESSKMSFMDWNHFAADQMIISDYDINRFKGMAYYSYSTNRQFLEAHYEHNFGGFVLNKFPLLKKLKFSEIGAVHFLTNDHVNRYLELNAGVQRGVVPVRIMFVTSFADQQKVFTGLRLAIAL